MRRQGGEQEPVQDIAESKPFGDIGAHARIFVGSIDNHDEDDDDKDEDEGRATTPLESGMRPGGRSVVRWTLASFRG